MKKHPGTGSWGLIYCNDSNISVFSVHSVFSVFIFLTTEGAEDTEEKHEKLQRQAQSEIPNEATNACAPIFVSEEMLHSNAVA